MTNGNGGSLRLRLRPDATSRSEGGRKARGEINEKTKKLSAKCWPLLSSRRGLAAISATSLFVFFFLAGTDGSGSSDASGRDGYSVSIPRSAELCPSMVRAGSDGDGGWWTCGESTLKAGVGGGGGGRKDDEKCVVYSFGICDNFSFDHFAASRGCEVHGFDPSPAGLRSKDGYEQFEGGDGTAGGGGGGSASYHSYGLGPSDEKYGPGKVPFRWPGLGYLSEGNTQSWQLYKLPTILSKLGSDSGLTVLKVDIEGGEWDVMSDIVRADWDELYLELHFPVGEYALSKSSVGEGLEVTRTRTWPSGLRGVLSQKSSLLLAHRDKQRRPARNVSGPIDRIGILKMLLEVSDMFFWEPNGTECVEIYFRRREGTKGGRVEAKVLKSPSLKDVVD